MANHKKVAKEKIYNTPLYNAIRKYGWENLEIEILLQCKVEDVDELERLYIAKFKALDRNFGYNLDTGGVLNKKHSSSTRAKISNTNKNKSVHTFRTRTKKIVCYTLDMEFVGIYERIYESASEAARIHGVASNTIARVARGGRKSSCGYVWRWVKDTV